ncbi:mersacidin/lichenicidin family type 2 lantibiotic [Streptomyces sp. S.PNR 29]|uniref:mersacidin/lichenicidin family type 2 lantibiotic n=1 Tax=Streptomyces sp. S.PNR 29 TaxID=2973805 RepID=UPI0025B224E9|nr:mersacidin/lichenicidin family type 2 lantibiotic [Streptomyces sp. S.PNR 29]MDN0200004.1 mersacidin/lichenicidin family type 2 lantibiotic [Streptomyces sp. S.PNR 29]
MDSVRAWKDPEYRRTLAAPPQHPSGTPGLSKLDSAGLAAAAGGAGTGAICLIKTATLTIPVWCVVTLAVCP